MIRLLLKFFNSRLFKFLIKTIGSLASAIIVISGYLAFLNYSNRYSKDLPVDDVSDAPDPPEIENSKDE